MAGNSKVPFQVPFKVKLMSDSLAGKSYKTTGKTGNKFVVIHNMVGTSASSLSYWNGGSGGQHTSAHYCVDDKEIWQTLKDDWIGHHCGKPSNWAGKKGCSNNSSIGIEIADMNCNQRMAVEIAIDLARYLAKTYNIPYENIVRHKDVASTDCPGWIEKNNLWNYFKQEVERRDKEAEPLCFDASNAITGDTSPGNNGANPGGNMSSGNETLPNFDNREDWTNLKEIKGVGLICMPPQHFVTLKDRDKKWKEIGYSKEFHYVYDGKWKEEKDKTKIARSLKDNDRHTYIERALYNNKAEKNILSIGMFIPPMISDYPKYEKELINETAKVLYENKLKTKDLWREFDFNRTPSPFMLLDREIWKKFLREIDKQVKWRYENFGEPLEEEKDPATDGEDYSKIKDNIGKSTVTSRYCLLREHPSMTAPIIASLDVDTAFKIIDADTRGYYKIKLNTKDTDAAELDGVEGWITAKSAFFKKDGEEGKKEAKAFGACNTSPLMVSVSDKNVAAMAEKERDKKIPQPEITPTMTHQEYLYFQKLTDPKLIDDYVNECEPYDKKLKEIIDAPITNDDRLTALQKTMETEQNAIFKYAVTEGSPGDSGHCVKPTAELSMLVKPKEATKVDPIYPDLIIPPNYAPTLNNLLSPNIIPMSSVEDGSIIKEGKDIDNDKLSYDFELLNDKKKESKGKPINYLDPYPYDDKIIELEAHHPKIKIDEIEARLYESNHPGDPMPQPVAKNFALVYDAMLKQSSSIEKRLVKIENVLATVLRNQGRIGSRINVNCVYYGGQDTFGKYKTIRCLCDDRVHDACSVTLDQCLSCTRYEPILGQVYDILDDTGLNGTVFLDDMQMGYMGLDDLKNLNRVERRSSKTKFANLKKDGDKPTSMIDVWKARDKNNFIAKLKLKVTDEKEVEKKIKDIKDEDFAFIMNWYEEDLDIQKPDVKEYPLEGIKARYKEINKSNPGEDTYSSVLDDETDQDVIKDNTDMDKINRGEWVDTREKADTVETNNYSTEQYYFEDFNIPRASSGGAASPGGVFGAEARNKIVEKAREIVQLHAEGKAGYSQGNNNSGRTYDDEKRVMGSNMYLTNVIIYDCSSLVSCCYKYAGLMSMYNKNTEDQCKAMIAKNDKQQFWLANRDGVAKALPGDIIYRSSGSIVSEANLGTIYETEHVGIYIGNNQVAHASSGKRPVPKQICIVDVGEFLGNRYFFARPWDLIEADKKASANNTNGGGEVKGSIITSKGETYNYIYSFPKAVCSGYTDVGRGASGAWCDPSDNNVVAAHNIPYETIIYIKELDGKGGGGVVTMKDGNGYVVNTIDLGRKGNGIYFVGDTGGPYFDFDICTRTFSEKKNMDVLVVSWGKTQIPVRTFSAAIAQEGAAFPKYPEAIQSYKRMNGVTINFWKFSQEDRGLSQSTRWTSI